MRVKLAISIISFVFSVVICTVGTETILHIWAPPYLKAQSGTILLTKNFVLENNFNFNSKKIRDHIIIKKNSLGFRGAEPPMDFSRHTTIIAVGGSTTECIFVTEGKTWTDVLNNSLRKKDPNIWVNNAGIDGHSTFGSTELIKQYVGAIKPNYVLFLVGINDMAIDQGRREDNEKIVDSTTNQHQNIIQKIKNQSMILNFFKYIRSPKGGHALTAMTDSINDYRVLGLNTDHDQLTPEVLKKFTEQIRAYKVRLRSLMLVTKNYSIKPVLITQPAVYGYGIDDVTGVDLGEIMVSDFTEPGIKRTGSDKWQLLEMYNTATKQVAEELNIPVINLADEMPKSTRYYYDYIHFTEEGAAKVGEIVASHLSNIIN